ncbi:MAG: hypothetical protein OES24_07915 [Acidimicrobiia bacterium]|nr:hypothetical protein [Acidimicrobiia bacterium]
MPNRRDLNQHVEKGAAVGENRGTINITTVLQDHGPLVGILALVVVAAITVVAIVAISGGSDDPAGNLAATDGDVDGEADSGTGTSPSSPSSTTEDPTSSSVTSTSASSTSSSATSTSSTSTEPPPVMPSELDGPVLLNALQSMGVEPDVYHRPSNLPSGTVTFVSPPAGSEIAVGSRPRVEISTGRASDTYRQIVLRDSVSIGVTTDLVPIQQDGSFGTSPHIDVLTELIDRAFENPPPLQFVPLTAQSRFTATVTGEVDVELGGSDPERVPDVVQLLYTVDGRTYYFLAGTEFAGELQPNLEVLRAGG